jgi:hypothetical protein
MRLTASPVVGKLAKYGNKVRKAVKAVDAAADAARALDKLDDARRTFNSFDALKLALGLAGQSKEWHHIVEQRPSNIARFGPEAIHNTANVVAVPKWVNQKIAAYYSSKQRFTGGKTVREWLDSLPYEKQMEFGRMILDRVLKGKPLP